MGRNSGKWQVNLLLALAVSVVVNFSYVLLLMVENRSEGWRGSAPHRVREIQLPGQGRVSLSVDGYGYLIYADGPVDSVYISHGSARFLRLRDGDSLVASAYDAPMPGARPLLGEIAWRNGEPFDYSLLYNRPKEGFVFWLQFVYFLAVAFVLLSIATAGRRVRSLPRSFVRRCLICLAVTVVLYFLAPVTRWHNGELILLFMGDSSLDYNLIMKCSFVLVVSLLYGQISELAQQRQAIELENEHLKNENLSTRYNMLVSQINPHFFFNSLNSLAMLVRERDEEKALTYLDQLSYTFRYILQNGQSTLTTLGEELRFAEAYGYMFRIRYADKLDFDFRVEERWLNYRLPVLSLQELLSNAVKHNAITRSCPFRVTIAVEEGVLVVSNPRIPKLDAEPSTGIGLKNLNSRWQLIAARSIVVEQSADRFTVRLPLIKPQGK